MNTTNKHEPEQPLPRWSDGVSRYDSGLRWGGPAPKKTNKTVSQITTNISGLTVDQKIARGANIISKSTGNPLVPGNGPTLAAFSAEQSAFTAANTAVLGAHDSLRQLVAARGVVEKSWTAKCNNLADFTQIATEGDEVAILTSGFGVRAANTPAQPLGAPENLQVATNGSPGISKLKWAPVDGAVSYLVQCTMDATGVAGWAQVATPTKAKVEVSGADPGKPCLFRVSAVGPAGEGPWSEPSRRPVM